MPELPKIVTSRLAGRSAERLNGRLPDNDPRPGPGTPHPDADLLTAFLECALPDRERGAILSHLADCPPCREIVALALPSEDAASTVVARRPARPRLFLWRWGALAACGALAVSLAVHQQKPQETALLAKRQLPETTSEPKAMPPASGQTILGDSKQPAAPPEATHRETNSNAQAVPGIGAGIEANTGIDAKKKRQTVPLASPVTAKASDVGKDTITTGGVTNLPLNGRNFTQLERFAPPGGTGAAGGILGGVVAAPKPTQPAVAGAAQQAQYDSAQTSQAQTSPDAEKAAEGAFARARRDEGTLAKQTSRAAGSASATPALAARAPAASVPIGSAETGAATTVLPGEGEIRGVVLDPSGAVVSDAQVTITNAATGVSFMSTTNSAGVYAVPSVPVGPYTIAVSKSGFQAFFLQGVNVAPPATAVNATLQVGATSATVEVSAQAPLVDTTSASTTTAVAPTDKDEFRASSAEIANLPGLAKAGQAATWQITDAGNLQRSFDGGKSWESVSVSPPTRLRAVTATGFQVWAGGNGGALFHSQDAGDHFSALKVRKKHAALTGDIVNLTFQDAQHGRVETADHDVWTTSDGGKSWLPSAAAK